MEAHSKHIRGKVLRGDGSGEALELHAHANKDEYTSEAPGAGRWGAIPADSTVLS